MGKECTVLADGGGGVVKEREGNKLTLLWLRLISSHFISPFIMFVSFCNSPTHFSRLLPVLRFSFAKEHPSRTVEFLNHFWYLLHSVFFWKQHIQSTF